MTARVFISYRRNDSKYQARMIYGAFQKVVPRDCLFMDINSIPLGVDFVETLRVPADSELVGLLHRLSLIVRAPVAFGIALLVSKRLTRWDSSASLAVSLGKDHDDLHRGPESHNGHPYEPTIIAQVEQSAIYHFGDSRKVEV